MSAVSIRDLRNSGGDIVDRAARGEEITITRDGVPVAELRPVARPGLSADAVLGRYRHAPKVDAERLREELDALLDQRW